MKRFVCGWVLLAGCLGEDGGGGLAVTIRGEGHAWVQDQGTGRICESDCRLPVMVGPDDGRAVLAVGSPEQLIAVSCEPGSSGWCAASPGKELVVEVQGDPHAVFSLLADGPLGAVAFTAGSDLVLSTEAGLRRVGLDGAVRWEVAAPIYSQLVVAQNDLVIAGSQVTAYRSDGTRAWQSPLTAKQLATGAGTLAALTTDRVVVLSLDTGGERWSVAAPGATAIAVSGTGIVAVAMAMAGQIAMFDGAGTHGTDLPSPGLVKQLAFDGDDLLVAAVQAPNAQRSGVIATSYVRLDRLGNVVSASPAMTSLGASGLAVSGTRVFTWSQRFVPWDIGMAFPAGLRVDALDAAGVAWTVDKPIHGNLTPHEMWFVDQLVPRNGACDHAGHCAVTATYTFGSGFTHDWLEVFSVL